ncbi:hypothetical protein CLV42_107116 [Chitinophaga ginsengisoli]|uniref:Outer membrane protein with beta-barrel domain n=2 Tax=Chitinophaga ginsengisoli TaxID=363837 RepID=A0A2P8G4R2_9BACT|nr:hypothetical protein CLV42_107116 [Chitinophaga ginsengisoli]
MHAVGGGFFGRPSNALYDAGGLSWTYSPRYSFAEKKRTSLSIGIPLTAGIANVFDDLSEGKNRPNTRGYMITVPLMFNFNIGAGSARSCKEKYGYFVGAGYAYQVGSVYEAWPDRPGYDFSEPHTRSTTGPAFNIGGRIALGRERKHIMEVRALFMAGITSYKFGLNEFAWLIYF